MATRRNIRYPEKNGQRVHRIVAAEKLGRPLLTGETVHHINGDPTDNRPENLRVYASHADHIMLGHGSDLVTVGEIEDLILMGYGSEVIVARCRIGTHRLVRIRRRLEKRLGMRIHRIGERMGLTPPPPLQRPTFDWDEAIQLREQGWTFAAIGRRYGVTGEAVSYAVKTTLERRLGIVYTRP